MFPTRTLIATQAKLYLREPANVFFALVFPALLLVAVGFILPGMRDPIEDAGPAFAGLRPIDLYLPAVLALAVATIALTTYPPVFAIYREKGVLRRFATTPVPASRLLGAEIVVNLVALVAGVVLALVAGWLLLDFAMPSQPLVVVGGFVLGALALMAVGSLIAAVAPTGGAASAISMSLYFPMLFFAGIWLPGPAMPEVLQRVATAVPLGSVAQALTEGWFGGDVPWLQLAVLAAWTVVLVPLAARLFRWT